MPNVDPLIARRPELADTQPDLRVLASRDSKPITLARLKESATPFLLGAGVGAGITLAVTALSHKNMPRYTLFPAARTTLFGNLAKVALIAVGRTLLRRAFAHAVERAAMQPA